MSTWDDDFRIDRVHSGLYRVSLIQHCRVNRTTVGEIRYIGGPLYRQCAHSASLTKEQLLKIGEAMDNMGAQV